MSALTIIQPIRKSKSASAGESAGVHPVCARCTALCCRYVTQEILRPRDNQDLDDLRWMMMHRGVNVLIMSRRWYLQFESVCRHLLPDNRCGIYDTRPQACRDYEADPCDFTVATGASVEDYVTFHTYEQVHAYIKKGVLPAKRS